MEKIDGKWLKDRFEGKRGEKARLAEAIGLSSEKLSKVLSGKRQLKSHETQLVLEYFADKVPLSPSQAGTVARMKRLSAKGQEALAAHAEYLLSLEDKGSNDPDPAD